MRRTGNVWVGRPRALALAISAALATWSTSSHATDGPAVAVELLRRTPISFERNDGQFPAEVLYVARGLAGPISLRRGELHLGSLPLKLARANLAPEAEGRNLLETRSHHYLGPRRHENVPHFSEVRLRDVYPSIDLAVHGTQGSLEYDFVVAPGADPSNIALDVSAFDSAQIDGAGQLVMRKEDRTLVQRAPIAWQDRDGTRVPVEARFRLRETAGGREAYFALAGYDPTRALVIDPILSYSTYLGGGEADSGGYLQIDSAGKLYIAESIAGATGTAVVVTKLDPVSNTVVFATTIDGSDLDVVQGLAIGASGTGFASYIAGYTRSDIFPTCDAGCPPIVHSGGDDAFVTVLDDNGVLVRSWLLGGSGDDQANGIALDAAKNIHVVGSTNSFDFPTTTPSLYHNRLGSSADPSDAFLVKINGATGLVQYGTYLGGSAADYGTAIALDSSGNMYVGGYTESGNFPRVNPALVNWPAMFVTKIGASGGPIIFSTNLGGSGDELVGLAVEAGSNKTWIVGDTDRANFLGASGGFSGGRDVFVSRLGASGSPIEFSKLIGGSGLDYAGGLALGASGSNDVYVTGITSSMDFPVLGGGSANPGGASAFIARLRGTSFDYSSYLGGSGNDYGSSVALSPFGEIYVAGWTGSIDFPTVNPYRATLQGGSDIFVSRLLFEPGAPRNVAVLSGDGQLTFTFSSPASAGGSSITGYTVTCDPGGVTASGSGSPIMVTGLTNGVLYTCFLTATNGVGIGAPAVLSARPAAPVTLSHVVSRRVHGGVEVFDWTVDPSQSIDGALTIESRGGAQVVVFNFTGPVYSAGGVSVRDAQNLFYPVTPTVASNSIAAVFSTVPAGKRVTVSLFNVNNQNYNPSVSLSLVTGDLNGSRGVTASDILIAKGKIGEFVLGATFQYDVDLDHDLGQGDVDAVKAKSGTEQQ